MLLFGATVVAALSFFAKDGTLEDNGWECLRSQRQDVFSVKAGVVTMVCSPNPYNGSCYRRKLEKHIEKGVLEFDVNPTLPGSAHSHLYYLPAIWKRKWGYSPLLAETFCNIERTYRPAKPLRVSEVARYNGNMLS